MLRTVFFYISKLISYKWFDVTKKVQELQSCISCIRLENPIRSLFFILFFIILTSLCNQDLRKKAARLVSAKCTLAARVDACHESVHGEIGLRFKEEIEKKLDKLQVLI